jgi:hypothetical protein
MGMREGGMENSEGKWGIFGNLKEKELVNRMIWKTT